MLASLVLRWRFHEMDELVKSMRLEMEGGEGDGESEASVSEVTGRVREAAILF